MQECLLHFSFKGLIITGAVINKAQRHSSAKCSVVQAAAKAKILCVCKCVPCECANVYTCKCCVHMCSCVCAWLCVHMGAHVTVCTCYVCAWGPAVTTATAQPAATGRSPPCRKAPSEPQTSLLDCRVRAYSLTQSLPSA